MQNTNCMLNTVKKKKNVRKFTFSNRITSAWNALSLITKLAPNINKFKNLLDRYPNVLVNKFDCDSFSLFFFKGKLLHAHADLMKLSHKMGRKKAAEAYSSSCSVSV